jgi:hypothetical protein
MPLTFLDWSDRANCKDTDATPFFPEPGKNSRQAKKVCAACEVITQCRKYAMDNPELEGVWGGQTEDERFTARGAPIPRRRSPTQAKQLRRPRKSQAATPNG